MLQLSGDWRAEMLGHIEEICRSQAGIIALAVLGSEASGGADRWSDLDLLVVASPDILDDIFPPFAWLPLLGELYASELHRGEFTSVARLCFTDLRRVDLIVTTSDRLARFGEWSELPFANGNHVVFSHDPTVTAVLRLAPVRPMTEVPPDAVDSLTNSFWYKATVAVQKAVRGDRLVAFHLSLEMIQEVAVLAMMLRDRETGTNRHRGGLGDADVLALEPTRQPHTPLGILDSIEASAVAFDGLTARWSSTHRANRGPLLRWIAAAREEIDA